MILKLFLACLALLAPIAADAGPRAEISANHAAMADMDRGMMAPPTGDADVDFADEMLAHHRGAVEMAQVELRYGHDPQMRALAQRIIAAQQGEIDEMQTWKQHRGAGPTK